MEATFLGIMLFGIHRVRPWVHTLATCVVAVGTTLSAFWIVALNSWMHTPDGFVLRDGVAFPEDWLAIVVNPSMPYRLTHVLLASGLTASFLVAGVSAYRLLRGDPKPAPRLALRTAVVVAAVLAPLQILAGDLHGLNTLEHQPAKIAAMEAVWETREGAPLLLFALPNERERKNELEVGIPHGASLILTHDPDGVVRGLNEFPDAHPPVAPVFWGFRVMVGTGVLMLVVAWYSVFRLRGDADAPRRLLLALVAMTFSGWLATLAGWYVTEIGRQPFLVSGVLRTAAAVTSQPTTNVMLSLVAYLGIYACLLVAYVSTLFHLAARSAELEKDLYEQGPTVELPAQSGRRVVAVGV